MPREGATIFWDIVGQLAVLRAECNKCGRRGPYRLHRLIVDDLRGARCPDLPNVLPALACAGALGQPPTPGSRWPLSRIATKHPLRDRANNTRGAELISDPHSI
jgi:hypothetical protein